MHSDSSVSCPCEGTNTPSESEHEDNDNATTPFLNDDHQLILPSQASLQPPAPFQPFGGQRSQPPVIFGATSTVIPKRKHSSKHKKKSKHSAKAVPEDLNTKLPAIESLSVKKPAKKLLKKKKAKKTKQSKRLFKKGVRNQPSSDESDSGSEVSEEESSYDSSNSSILRR